MREVTEAQVVALMGMAAAGTPEHELTFIHLAMNKNFCEDFATLLTALVIANSIP